MKKIPPYLKGLIETRARAAAEVDRYRRLAEEIAAALEKTESELRAAENVLCIECAFDAR